MKKIMQVFFENYWQSITTAFILYILFFSSLLFAAENPKAVSGFEQQEFQVLRKALEAENTKLQGELLSQKHELEQLRTLYADSLIKQNTLLEALQELEIAALNLLQGIDDKELQKRFSEALAALVSVKERVLEIEKEYSSLEKSLRAAMDGMQISAVMRQEIEDGLANFRKVIESSLNPLSIVAGRGSAETEKNICSILKVDKNSQCVILNKGYLQGMKNGTLWYLERANKNLAEVKVVECRADYSAAILIKGKWTSLLPGSSLNQKK